MSEQPTRAQHLATLREKFASAPPVANHDGRTDLDRRLDLERAQRIDAAYADQPAAPTQPATPPTGMRPDPAQGRASSPEHVVPTQPAGSTAERIRARITDAGDAAFDDGSRVIR